MAVDTCLAVLEDLTTPAKEANVPEHRMSTLIEDALSDLIERYQDEKYPEDLIHEIADSHTPIYNSDIMAYAQDDFSLATEAPELGPAFDGEATAINIIASNIYERIYSALSEKLVELKEGDNDESD